MCTLTSAMLAYMYTHVQLGDIPHSQIVVLSVCEIADTQYYLGGVGVGSNVQSLCESYAGKDFSNNSQLFITESESKKNVGI